MKSLRSIRVLFVVAALYDGILGLAFLLAAPALFSRLQITPPNHFGYVHFGAALLIVFALMFAAVARDPIVNRNLIPYGILLKFSYCGTVLFHWMGQGIATPWKVFVVADVILAALFLGAYAATRPPATEEPK